MKHQPPTLLDDSYTPKVIKDIKVNDYETIISFEDGTELFIRDVEHHCCEERFMRTDEDNLPYYQGSKLIGIDAEYVRCSPSHNYDDVAFLNVRTTLGVVVIKSYNVHNGYYAGWDMRTEWRDNNDKSA